jgi:hypothetical protein
MVLQRWKAIGEPIFGAIKRAFGFRRWSQRGLEGVRGQCYWLYTALNLRKVYGLWGSEEVRDSWEVREGGLGVYF